ncbi:MAG: mercuric reductase [Planctomycetes bacterium]|nr:mercuric reductase [Planctomycetota bacterium]
MTDEHDRILAERVHPPGWVNPTAAPRYNLVVIGAGTAGLVSAAGAAGLGAKVALVERHLMGGDCLNVGCVPSKALLRCARAAADVQRAGEFGVVVPPGARVDFAAVMERMRRLRASISPNDSAERFRGLGVDVFFGEARFAGTDRVVVGDQALFFRKAVIATGGRAARPNIPGLAEAGYLTNETIFTLTTLPRRLAILGAGAIGCELAQAFARFGCQVTVIELFERILPRDDPDAGRLVHEAMRADGVDFRLGSEVAGVRSEKDEKVLTVKQGEITTEVRADAILVAVGRSPNVEGLDLEAAGVAYDPKIGVHVNDCLQTSNRRIYAAGDVCSRYQFTHAADAMARIVVQNALFLGRAKASALTIPQCTYTDPEIAHVGLTEAQAKESGFAIQTFMQELSHVDRAILDGETNGFVKIHVKAGTDRIVGATVVARHAGEMISELTLAMTQKLGLRKLAGVIQPYPTQAEAIKKIADAYNRTRLTPLVKWLFQKWLSWRR